MAELLRAFVDPETVIGVPRGLFYGGLAALVPLLCLSVWVTRLVRARIEVIQRERRRRMFEQSEMGRELREGEDEARRRRAEVNQRQLEQYESGQTTTMTRPKIRIHPSAAGPRDSGEPAKPALRYRKRQ